MPKQHVVTALFTVAAHKGPIHSVVNSPLNGRTYLTTLVDCMPIELYTGLFRNPTKFSNRIANSANSVCVCKHKTLSKLIQRYTEKKYSNTTCIEIKIYLYRYVCKYVCRVRTPRHEPSLYEINARFVSNRNPYIHVLYGLNFFSNCILHQSIQILQSNYYNDFKNVCSIFVFRFNINLGFPNGYHNYFEFIHNIFVLSS